MVEFLRHRDALLDSRYWRIFCQKRPELWFWMVIMNAEWMTWDIGSCLCVGSNLALFYRCSAPMAQIRRGEICALGSLGRLCMSSGLDAAAPLPADTLYLLFGRLGHPPPLQP